MSLPILEIDNVTVQFGGVIAVNNASLTINNGELIGFVGPNGAGKTTLMRVITGIVTPQKGIVKLAGKNLHGLSISQRINTGLALAQQIVQPLRELTILENVALACGRNKTKSPFKAITHFDRREENSKALSLLERVGLIDHAHDEPSTLPLGYLKRLEVARALALEPSLLLLDEPLAGLNQAEAQELANLIKTLNDDGLTILLIEHNLREVMRICPLVYVQDQGKSLALGETKQDMSRTDVVKAYLGGG